MSGRDIVARLADEMRAEIAVRTARLEGIEIAIAALEAAGEGMAQEVEPRLAKRPRRLALPATKRRKTRGPAKRAPSPEAGDARAARDGRIRSLHGQGKWASEIAEAIGESKSGVYQHLKRLGLMRSEPGDDERAA